MIGIGFSSNKASLERLPGWEQESWAYHGDDGKTFFGENPGQGRPYGPTFGTHDAVGCGVNFSTGRAFFTKNGIFLGWFGWLSSIIAGMSLLTSTESSRLYFPGFERCKAISIDRSEETAWCHLDCELWAAAVCF